MNIQCMECNVCNVFFRVYEGATDNVYLLLLPDFFFLNFCYVYLCILYHVCREQMEISLWLHWLVYTAVFLVMFINMHCPSQIKNKLN